MSLRPVGLRDHLFGLAICVVYVVVLLLSSRGLGMARDEGFYVVAAERTAAWIEEAAEDWERASSREGVDRGWSYNSEHPPLMKTLFALSWIAQKKWDVFPMESMAFRFPGMVSAGLLLWLIYIFGARAYRREVGAFGALAYALLPQPFYHSHLDCFDVPITFLLTLVTYCYWRSLRDKVWNLWLGIAFGFALATKHNAWILPGVLMIHWLWVVWVERRERRSGKAAIVSYVPYWLFAILLLGPPIFVGTWPWLWFDAEARMRAYAAFHLHHDYYNMVFLGVNYFRPPFPIAYPIVMTLFTVPATTIALSVGAIATRVRAWTPPVLLERLFPSGRVVGDRVRTDVLMLGCFIAPIFVIALPSTPIFGGTKHWYPAFPFMALFAGLGFSRLVDVAAGLLRARAPRLELRLKREGLSIVAGALLLSPSLVETIHSHPFGLSHYTFLAGGTPGAADYGMNRQFWGFTTGSLVPWFKEKMPQGGTVWPCDTTHDAWRMLQRDGLLPENIRIAGSMATADFAIVHHEHHVAEVDFQIWTAWQRPSPVYVLTHDGVPIISVYENPSRRR